MQPVTKEELIHAARTYEVGEMPYVVRDLKTDTYLAFPGLREIATYMKMSIHTVTTHYKRPWVSFKGKQIFALKQWRDVAAKPCPHFCSEFVGEYASRLANVREEGSFITIYGYQDIVRSKAAFITPEYFDRSGRYNSLMRLCLITEQNKEIFNIDTTLMAERGLIFAQHDHLDKETEYRIAEAKKEQLFTELLVPSA